MQTTCELKAEFSKQCAEKFGDYLEDEAAVKKRQDMIDSWEQRCLWDGTVAPLELDLFGCFTATAGMGGGKHPGGTEWRKG